MAFFKFAASLRRALIPNYYIRTVTTKQTAKERLQNENLPEKPKKPLTPYFRFLRDYRDSIVKNQSSTASKSVDIVRMGAADWAKANATIKNKYHSEYQAEMQEYSKQLSAYTAALSAEHRALLEECTIERIVAKKKRDLRKKCRTMEKPKRPMGPYMQFLMERSKGSDKKMVDLMVELRGHWKCMGESERARYQQMFQDDRDRYNKAMEEWEKDMIEAGHTDIVRHATLQKTAKANDEAPEKALDKSAAAKKT